MYDTETNGQLQVDIMRLLYTINDLECSNAVYYIPDATITIYLCYARPVIVLHVLVLDGDSCSDLRYDSRYDYCYDPR